MQPMHVLFASMRAHGPALLASADEPVAELLAMVWGPRFDRDHAQHLAQSATQKDSGLHHALAQAADSFDDLPAPRQQRLRQLLCHRAGGTITA
ncbi:MAG: hypothetical protein ABIZ09_08725 [Rhodoferax sp.]